MNWAQFEELIIKQFQKFDESLRARDRLQALKQSRSVTDYIGEFNALIYQIQDLAESEAFYQFKKGLKTSVLVKMDELNIQIEDDNALQRLQEAAQRYDTVTFYHRKDQHNDRYKGPHKSGFPKRNVNEIDTKAKRDNTNITCYACDKKGHMAKDCRSKDKKPYKKKNGLTNTETRKLNMVTVGFQKLSPTATIPAYKTSRAAGADLSPNESGVIEPNSTKRIKTGLAAEIPEGYHGEIHARSSMLMENISITGIIDSDYRGEIELIVRNHNPYTVKYSATGKPIAQIIIKPNIQVEFTEVQQLTQTARKGGFGSTNIEAISIHPGKLVFEGKLNNQTTEFLIDSGADGLFCGKNMAKKAKLKVTELNRPLTITMADGKEHSITKVAKNIPYSIQGFKDNLDLYIMPADHDQVILGNHWLDHLNPTIDWRKKEATINKNGKLYTLQVNVTKRKGSKETQVNYLLANDDFKLDEDDQLLLVHMGEDIDEELGITPISQPETEDPDLQKLLQEYNDVFRTELPSEKPTKRDVEHVIRLKQDAKPQNARQF